MPTDKVLSHRSGAIAHIVFNNPEKHNATSLEMWARMGELASEFAADPEVRVLVISGAGGKAFVSGADISKFETERASKEAVEHYNAVSVKANSALWSFPKPVVAKINGYCIGGGMNVAMGCDVRICEDKARFGIPAARLGLGYGPTNFKKVADVIGPAMALDLFYSARQLDAAEALRIGLVNMVVPAAELDKAVDDYCAKIAENAPMTIAAIKASARELARPEKERDLARVERMVDACFASQDYIEGRRAFMEKRKPRFQGR
jgi:enoyl-CoA hydratase/carnithine racemase